MLRAPVAYQGGLEPQAGVYLLYRYPISNRYQKKNKKKKSLLSERWNRKCLTATSSLTDTHLVYKITLCLRRQLPAGQRCPLLCLAIASRKQDSGGRFCVCPAVLVSSEELRSGSRGSCLLLSGSSWKGCQGAGAAPGMQPPPRRERCAPRSLQGSRRQASARTPPSQDGLGSCHMPQLFYLLLHKRPGHIRARIYPLLVIASINLLPAESRTVIFFPIQRALIYSAVKNDTEEKSPMQNQQSSQARTP